jgi:predicted esterase
MILSIIVPVVQLVSNGSANPPHGLAQVSTNYITTTVNARYWQLGELDEHTNSVWFVLHGQGQLAEYFIRKFNSLVNKNTVVVAPEALHRYYLDGFSGKVGASWMTKEDRLTDIANYLEYLDKLYLTLLQGIHSNNCVIHLLGFSQGTATVCRWATNGNIEFDHLVIWAGLVPPEITRERAQKHLKNKKVDVVYGNLDPYLTDSTVTKIQNHIQALEIDYELHEFEGVHEIDKSVLKLLDYH